MIVWLLISLINPTQSLLILVISFSNRLSAINYNIGYIHMKVKTVLVIFFEAGNQKLGSA